MTRRDLQLAARAKQRPWDLGKDVEASAVIAALTPAAEFTIGAQRIALSVNGETKQDATLGALLFIGSILAPICLVGFIAVMIYVGMKEPPR